MGGCGPNTYGSTWDENLSPIKCRNLPEALLASQEGFYSWIELQILNKAHYRTRYLETLIIFCVAFCFHRMVAMHLN
jgi:hypothetical protein